MTGQNTTDPAPPPAPVMSQMIADICLEAGIDDADQFMDIAENVLPPDDFEELIATLSGTWWPQAHQIVPDTGDVLFEGGRGTGKTATITDAVNRHMMGPPCDPSVPGGHRAVIVAPIIGDAYQTAYLGPSSIRAHNPLVKPVNIPGGIHLQWPNGALMLMLGGNKPDSPNRTRAGGNI